jgi:hypothetical protein
MQNMLPSLQTHFHQFHLNQGRTCNGPKKLLFIFLDSVLNGTEVIFSRVNFPNDLHSCGGTMEVNAMTPLREELITCANAHNASGDKNIIVFQSFRPSPLNCLFTGRAATYPQRSAVILGDEASRRSSSVHLIAHSLGMSIVRIPSWCPDNVSPLRRRRKEDGEK